MSYFVVGGLEIIPSKCTPNLYDITGEDTKRNANGDLIADLIAPKKKFELVFNFLTSVQLSVILTVIKSSFFQTVQYHNPITNSSTTGTFYIGDISCPHQDWHTGSIRYANVKWNLIER